MNNRNLPLELKSIRELFCSDEKVTYEVPIYQRNYAWGKEEIDALVQDIYDASLKLEEHDYYIGTLVSYYRGDNLYEVIDGQQRLTTIWLLLKALQEKYGIKLNSSNRLTYRSRKKADQTINQLPNKTEDADASIAIGFDFVKTAIGAIVQQSERVCYPEKETKSLLDFFMDNVKIVHYQVPKDVDLNHYFEVMNSRGEQLEKHEVVKAQLLGKIKDEHDRWVFNRIWESCTDMGNYIQRKLENEDIFGRSLTEFKAGDFDDVKNAFGRTEKNSSVKMSVNEMLQQGVVDAQKNVDDTEDKFQPIIDFPNFLLIVLKIVRMKEENFKPGTFNLDDKYLLEEFNPKRVNINAREFAFYLLKAKYLLDNYIVHHTLNDESEYENVNNGNPWRLQQWHRNLDNRKSSLKNTAGDGKLQNNMVQLLSMFEVSFTARQRKNYLFYCLMYLMDRKEFSINGYAEFLEGLANRYFHDVYLVEDKLNQINTPKPGSFDEEMLVGNRLKSTVSEKDICEFQTIYGDGTVKSKGIPLFIFNYLDYRIWRLYADTLRGNTDQRVSRDKEFNQLLGCYDLDREVFDSFYFSRTRRSLEHFYAQALVSKEDKLTDNKINCFGNYAMIGSAMNSSGSDWTPMTKRDHYLDKSGKISRVSVASLKFAIMMDICREEGKWEFQQIRIHQYKMLDLLFGDNLIANHQSR